MLSKSTQRIIIGICLNCGKSFSKRYRKRPVPYCSKECYWKDKPNQDNWETITCICGKQFQSLKVSHRKYCSRKCFVIDDQKRKNTKEYKDFISKLHTGRKRPLETGQRISQAQKKTWQNRSEEEKRIIAQKIRESVVNLYKQGVYTETYPHELPSGLERKFIAIIEKYNLPFRYVGDFQVWIEWMNPDFIHFTEPIVIEIQSNYCHNKKETKERVEKFSAAGYLCIPIWQNELRKEDLVIDKLNSFGFMNISKVVQDNEISVEDL